jgi:MSHA biogenesis protein MshN
LVLENSKSYLKSILIAKTNRPLNNKQLAEIKYQLALKHMANGINKEASEVLQASLVDDPGHIKARKALAALMTNNGLENSAIDVLEKGLEIVPEYTLFRRMIARILVGQNDYARAIQTLEKGMPVFFTHTEYYALLAAIYQRDQQHHKAVQLYKKLTHRDPQLGMWWLGLGISLEAQQKQSAALKAFIRARGTGSLSANVSQFVKKKVRLLTQSDGSG